MGMFIHLKLQSASLELGASWRGESVDTEKILKNEMLLSTKDETRISRLDFTRDI